MYKNVLVPVALDHGAKSQAAFDIAKRLVDADGRITLLHVLEEIPGYASAHLPEGTLQKNHDGALAEVKNLRGTDASNVEVDVAWGHASRTILERAEDSGANCIVIASHKPGLEDYFLGSTAARVVRHARCSVHVIR